MQATWGLANNTLSLAAFAQMTHKPVSCWLMRKSGKTPFFTHRAAVHHRHGSAATRNAAIGLYSRSFGLMRRQDYSTATSRL